MFFSFPYIRKYSQNKAQPKTSRESQKLSNDLDVELLKESKEFVHTVVAINNGKILK